MRPPVFAKGDKVELMQAVIGVADGADREVVVPAGSPGEVVCVRECGAPDGAQGPWLYDVEFPVDVDGAVDIVWGIYDATDADQLRVVQ